MKTLTDFTVWLAFVVTLMATVLLIAIGTYQLLNINIKGFYLIGGAVLTMAMHYGVRKL